MAKSIIERKDPLFACAEVPSVSLSPNMLIPDYELERQMPLSAIKGAG